MRPRIAFAALLAIGAAMHLPLLTMPARSLVPIVMYSGWLLISGAVAVALWLRVRQADPVLDSRARLRGRKVPGPRVEGLGWFVITAASGLVLHFLHAFGTSGPRPGRQGLWIVLFALATGCAVQLRGPVGDANAPIPDGSTVARVGHVLRRLAGIAISSVGIGLVYIGITSAGASGDGFALAISWFFKASGVIVFLIGLPFALLPPRDEA
jgi:hypothetical protein